MFCNIIAMKITPRIGKFALKCVIFMVLAVVMMPRSTTHHDAPHRQLFSEGSSDDCDPVGNSHQQCEFVQNVSDCSADYTLYNYLGILNVCDDDDE